MNLHLSTGLDQSQCVHVMDCPAVSKKDKYVNIQKTFLLVEQSKNG